MHVSTTHEGRHRPLNFAPPLVFSGAGCQKSRAKRNGAGEIGDNLATAGNSYVSIFAGERDIKGNVATWNRRRLYLAHPRFRTRKSVPRGTRKLERKGNYELLYSIYLSSNRNTHRRRYNNDRTLFHQKLLERKVKCLTRVESDGIAPGKVKGTISIAASPLAFEGM